MARGRARAGYETLARELRAGTVHPAYLVWGNERFLCERAVAEIVETALGAPNDPFNLTRYDAASHALAEALAVANELPMLRPRRVVVFEGLTTPDAYGRAKVSAKKPDRDRLLAYLAAPNPTTVLVLTGEVADARQKLVTDAGARLKVYEMSTPAPERLLRWIAGKAASLGFSMTPEASVDLVEAAGPSMTRLAVEIEKLGLYVGDGKSADVEDVRRLVLGGGRGASVFDLSDAIAAGDAEAAVSALREILDLQTDGEMRIFGELRRSLALWLRIRERLDAGEGPGAVAGSTGIAAYLVRRNLAGAEHTNLRCLVAAVSRLLEIERLRKLGRVGHLRTELEMLVSDLARGAACAGLTGSPASGYDEAC